MQIRDESGEVEHRISRMLILSITASFICVTQCNYYSIFLRTINLLIIEVFVHITIIGYCNL